MISNTLNAEQIIELGKISFVDYFFILHWLYTPFLVVAILMFILGMYVLIESFREGETAIVPFVLLVLLILTLIIRIFGSNLIIEDWKKEYVTPYIENLLVEKKEVVFIKDVENNSDIIIINDKEENSIDNYIDYTKNQYNYHNQEELNKMEIVLLKTSEDKYYKTYVIKKPISNEHSYIEFYYLEANLGEGISEGMYNVFLYIKNSEPEPSKKEVKETSKIFNNSKVIKPFYEKDYNNTLNGNNTTK